MDIKQNYYGLPELAVLESQQLQMSLKNTFFKRYKNFILDGDNIRHGLNNDLGFSDADRVENVRRVGEVSKLMLDAGIFVISSFISPFSSDRNMVKSLIGDSDYIEIFVDIPLDIAESRDQSLYESLGLERSQIYRHN